MKQTRGLGSGLGLVLAAALLAAAQNADFNGKWTLDQSESKLSPAGSSRPAPGGGYPGGGFPGGGFPGGRRGGGYPGGGYPRGSAGGGSRTANPEFGSREEAGLTLNIEQTANRLKISRKWTRDDKPQSMEQSFALDGKEDENPAPSGGVMVTRTNWKKGTLVTEGTQQMLLGDREVDLRINEEYSLSKDGKTLTVKTTRKSERGQMELKQTFKKADAS